MLTDASTRTALFSRLARPTGSFAILAIDQRESLRSLLAAAARPSSDEAVSEFKVDVVRHLSPYASAALIDPLYGLGPVHQSHVLAPSCGLIVAADRLIQPTGAPVAGTELDDALDYAGFVSLGAAALKLLVLWHPDRGLAERQAMVGSFVTRCAALGLLSVVEAIVRPPREGAGHWDRESAAVEAAAELGSMAPDLFKAEAPTLGQGTPTEIERLSRGISDSLACPWVVLSGGVPADRFPAAVAAACRGGASGFLAGRGIWGPSISAAEPSSMLATDAVNRLGELASIVDRDARPWQKALAA